MPNKPKTVLTRLTDHESNLLDLKSDLHGQTKANILRSGIVSFWNDHLDADQMLHRWQNNPDQQDLILDLLTQHYRKIGFPHSNLSTMDLRNEMIKLSRTKCPLLEDDHLQTNTVGTGLANHFHPHMQKVHTLQYRSPWEQWEDTDLLKDAIRRWMELGKKPNFSGIRKILRTRDGVKAAVNFKPAISMFLYHTYCEEGGYVLDPCSGFGGRLAGCIATKKRLHYCGIDPHPQTAVGNMQMASLFSRDWKFHYTSILGCAEDEMKLLPSEKFDLIFSSPPFFKIEIYSDDPTQSCIRYPTYDEWRTSFLRVLIEESKRLLKDGGHLILNLKNYKKEPLADDAKAIAKEIGLDLVRTFQMRMSNLEWGLGKSADKKWHTEPIFVWRN